MSRRTSALLVASWLLVPGLSRADDLDAEQLAKIRREQAAAEKKVDAAHGNKKPSEMSNDERRQVIEEKRAANEAVMQKNGVSDKDYARQTARMGPEGNKAVDAAEARQEAAEKAAREAAAKKQAEPQEVTIQQGISDKNPVEVMADPNAGPVIEHGTGDDDDPAKAAAAEKKDREQEKKEKEPSERHSKGGKKKKSRHHDDN